jgi:tRNA modification GTPase
MIINKIDLKKRLDVQSIQPKKLTVRLSALKGIGMADLENAIYDKVYRDGFVRRDDMISLRQWQKDILEEVHRKLASTEKYIDQGYSLDFVHFAVEEAFNTMIRFNGASSSEEILNDIFSNFCIGK